MSDIHVYRIFDTEKNTYWKSPNGKRMWGGKGPAKNAWNCAHTGWRARMNTVRFNDQTRYEIHTFELKRIY